MDGADPSLRATVHDVGGDYSDRCGSSSVPGKYACTAWVQDGKVAATMGFCFD
ncbi:hypothetical protein NR798_02640 [Archangium gephyra]|uniref:hypothetical protein n=1 Tax=Archangium gephyra TaxID=48 RepID=UPI0035D50E3B